MSTWGRRGYYIRASLLLTFQYKILILYFPALPDYNNKNKRKMNNPYSHMRRREQKQRRTTSNIPKADSSQPKKLSSGLNNQFLHARRENILNTGYNKRKSHLENITVENKKIYVKSKTM